MISVSVSLSVSCTVHVSGTVSPNTYPLPTAALQSTSSLAARDTGISDNTDNISKRTDERWDRDDAAVKLFLRRAAAASIVNTPAPGVVMTTLWVR